MAETEVIDHNQYIYKGHTFQANYQAGMRILDISGIASNHLEEVAYFDIYPEEETDSFNGSWSVYPYFDSGVVIVSGIEQGLYVLRARIEAPFFQDSFEGP